MIITDLARGAAAGIGATLPMSVVMLAAQRVGLMGTLPPEKVTESAFDAVGAPHTKTADDRVSSVAHLAYGATAGAVFGLGRRVLASRPVGVAAGIAFGLSVWFVSYEGWVPAFGIMPRIEHDRPGRPASMAAAHVVYGGVLGWLCTPAAAAPQPSGAAQSVDVR